MDDGAAETEIAANLNGEEQAEPLQWSSWEEYYLYFYNSYGRYPTEAEIQSLLKTSASSIDTSHQHQVFDEEEEAGPEQGGAPIAQAAQMTSQEERKSAKKKKRKRTQTLPSVVEAPTDDDYHDCGEEEYYEEDQPDDESAPPVSASNRKYWYQRYSLFSKWDDGIELDEEGWYSVTPESIARHIAAKCRKALLPAASSGKRPTGKVPGTVVDGMCGPGGNSIQFAPRFSVTFAVDIDPNKIRLAKHNATIYGVQDDIEFIIGDCTSIYTVARSVLNFSGLAALSSGTRVSRRMRTDAVFLSPPWGGPDYIQQDKFDIHSMTPDGFELFALSSSVSKNIAYLLPRNTDPMQMLHLAGACEPCEIEQNCACFLSLETSIDNCTL